MKILTQVFRRTSFSAHRRSARSIADKGNQDHTDSAKDCNGTLSSASTSEANKCSLHSKLQTKISSLIISLRDSHLSKTAQTMQSQLGLAPSSPDPVSIHFSQCCMISPAGTPKSSARNIPNSRFSEKVKPRDYSCRGPKTTPEYVSHSDKQTSTRKNRFAVILDMLMCGCIRKESSPLPHFGFLSPLCKQKLSVQSNYLYHSNSSFRHESILTHNDTYIRNSKVGSLYELYNFNTECARSLEETLLMCLRSDQITSMSTKRQHSINMHSQSNSCATNATNICTNNNCEASKIYMSDCIFNTYRKKCSCSANDTNLHRIETQRQQALILDGSHNHYKPLNTNIINNPDYLTKININSTKPNTAITPFQPPFLHDLRNFLAKEYCEETLDFLILVQKYHQHPTLELQYYVYNTYVREGAEMQVNLDEWMILDVEEQLVKYIDRPRSSQVNIDLDSDHQHEKHTDTHTHLCTPTPTPTPTAAHTFTPTCTHTYTYKYIQDQPCMVPIVLSNEVLGNGNNCSCGTWHHLNNKEAKKKDKNTTWSTPITKHSNVPTKNACYGKSTLLTIDCTEHLICIFDKCAIHVLQTIIDDKLIRFEQG